MLREIFSHIPPPGTQPPQPSSIMGEGMGEADIQQAYQLVEKQQFQPLQVSTSGGGEVVEAEKTVIVLSPPPVSGTGQALTPPTPSALLRTDRGEGYFHPLRPRQMGTFPSPVPPVETPRRGVSTGGGWRPGGGVELLQKRTSDFEASPLLEDQRISLCETLDRVLNTGVVVHGDITISVANIDLIYIGLRALLTSVETARQAGINLMTDS